MDWTSRRLDNSRTSQLADWTTRGGIHDLSGPRDVQYVSCLDGKLTSLRGVQSMSWQSASCPVTAYCSLYNGDCSYSYAAVDEVSTDTEHHTISL